MLCRLLSYILTSQMFLPKIIKCNKNASKRCKCGYKINVDINVGITQRIWWEMRDFILIYLIFDCWLNKKKYKS